MAANTSHPAFLQPHNVDIRLWKYLTFEKFLSLLVQNAVIFSRIDTFEDEFEGKIEKRKFLNAFSEMNHEMNIKMMEYIEQQPQHNSFMQSRLTNFATCWCMSNHESVALWKVFSKSDNSIAIQTKYSKLAALLPENTFLGCITYDFEEFSWNNPDNMFRTIMTKRKSFEYEKEVRALLFKPEYIKILCETKNINETIENIPKIQICPIDINELIESIYINPKAEKWFYDIVKDVCIKYKYVNQIRKSDLCIDNYDLM